MTLDDLRNEVYDVREALKKEGKDPSLVEVVMADGAPVFLVRVQFAGIEQIVVTDVDPNTTEDDVT